MPRKKKEEPEIYHTPFSSTTIPPHLLYPEIDLRPFVTTTRPSTSITYTGSTGDVSTIDYEDFTTLMRKIEKEEEAKVKINVENFKGKHVCCVRETLDLLPERILITLSAVKGKLMMDIAPVHVKEFQCSMTPAVRKNIIQASKQTRMYGKKMPIIARFDKYGRPLPEQIEINDSPGVNVKILDPANYGELYFEMVAIEFPKTDFFYEDEFLPF